MTRSRIGIALTSVAGAVAACGAPQIRQPVRTQVAEPAAVATQAPRPPAPPVQVAADQTFMVAGCNVECTNCAALDAGTHVVGREPGREQPLFAGPPSAGVAYSCNADVPLGRPVILRATASPHYEFVRWRLADSSRNDYCPCAGSSDPDCRVDVDAAVASRYHRAYCGAVWRKKSKPGANAIAR